MTISTPKQRPVPKAQLLTYIIGVVMVVLFAYGLIRYPDLPIRECSSVLQHSEHGKCIAEVGSRGMLVVNRLIPVRLHR
jgi:hypothetical protein